MNEELKVIISATVKPLEDSVKKVNKRLEGMDKSTQKATKSMTKSFDKSVASISKMGVAITAAAAGAVLSLGKFTKSLMDSGNDLFTLSSQTGLTTDRLQELQYAAEMTGSSADKLQRSVLRVSQAVEAGNPALAAMGINTTDSAEAFEQVLIGLSRMEEGTAKQKLGNELLGRSYADLKPLIDEGADGIRALSQAAHANGAVMSGPLLQSIETLRTSLHNMRESFKAAFYPILEIVIPILQKMVGWLMTAALWTRAFFGLFIKKSKDAGSSAEKLQNTVKNIDYNEPPDIGATYKDANTQAKKLQRTLFGFDVIHNIDEPQDGGAGGGGGGGFGGPGKIEIKPIDLDGLDEGLKSLEETAKMIEDIQEKIMKFWNSWGKPLTAIGAIIGGFAIAPAAIAGFMKLWDFIKFWGEFLPLLGMEKLENAAALVAKVAAEGGVLESVFVNIFAFLQQIGAFVANKLGFGIAVDGLTAAAVGAGLVVAAIVAIVAAVAVLYARGEEFYEAVNEAFAATKATVMSFYNNVMKPFVDFFIEAGVMIWALFIKPIWDGFVDLVEAILTPIIKLWTILQPILQLLFEFIGNMITPALDVLKVAIFALGTAFKIAFDAMMAVIVWVVDLIGDSVLAIVGWFMDVLMPPIQRLVLMFAKLWNAVRDAFLAIINHIVDTVGKLVEKFKEWWSSIDQDFIQKMRDGFEKFFKFFKDLFDGIKTIVDTIINFIVDLIGDNMDEILNIIQGITEFIKTYLSLAMEYITVVFTTAWELIKLVVSTVMSNIWSNIQVVWDTIKGIFTGVIDFVKNVFTGNWRGAWDAVIDIFRNLFGFIPKIFGNAWDAVMKLFSGGGKIFKGFATSVADIFKSLVNSLIRGINTVIGAPFKALNKAFDRFKGISILGAKPFSFLPTIGIPTIPQFATGGFPEDGLFHANSRELVGKFSNGKTAVANNDQIISGVSTGVANAVRGVLGDGMKTDQPINITVQIGADKIAKEVINAVDEYTMRTGITFQTI